METWRLTCKCLVFYKVCALWFQFYQSVSKEIEIYPRSGGKLP